VRARSGGGLHFLPLDSLMGSAVADSTRGQVLARPVPLIWS